MAVARGLRISENSVKAKFAEIVFYALRRIRSIDRAEAATLRPVCRNSRNPDTSVRALKTPRG